MQRLLQRLPIVQNFQTLLQDNRFVQQAFVQQNAFINQNIRGQMPGSSNDPPPAAPMASALEDRKREEVVKPIKDSKTSEVVKPIKKPKTSEIIKPKMHDVPKVSEARKIAPPIGN